MRIADDACIQMSLQRGVASGRVQFIVRSVVRSANYLCLFLQVLKISVGLSDACSGIVVLDAERLLILHIAHGLVESERHICCGKADRDDGDGQKDQNNSDCLHLDEMIYALLFKVFVERQDVILFAA